MIRILEQQEGKVKGSKGEKSRKMMINEMKIIKRWKEGLELKCDPRCVCILTVD